MGHSRTHQRRLPYGWAIVTLGFLASSCATSIGQSHSSNQAASASGKSYRYEVATIKPADPKSRGWKLESTIDGFTAQDVTLRMLIHEAYGIYEENRVEGGPAWMNIAKFDVEAKLDPTEIPAYADLSLDQRREMLLALLKMRFNLAAHMESRQMPISTLVVAKSGPKFHETQAANIYHSDIKGMDCLVTKSRRGFLEEHNCTTSNLAQTLRGWIGWNVIDKTGLTGRYDFALHSTPDELSVAPATPGSLESTEPQESGPVWPSIYTALQEQLGLKLQSAKDSMEVIVVDHLDMPTEN